MGQHVLPRQVLSSTSTICQIFNSEQKRAVVTDENGGKIYLDDVTEETLSKYVCVDRSGENTQRYKTVDIYWPVPMLKVKSPLLVIEVDSYIIVIDCIYQLKTEFKKFHCLKVLYFFF